MAFVWLQQLTRGLGPHLDSEKSVNCTGRSRAISLAGDAALAMIYAYKSIAKISGTPTSRWNGKEIYLTSKYFRLDSGLQRRWTVPQRTQAAFPLQQI
ncbi:hypothetical protein [Rhizobium sp. 18055]|uniref:hypothetical protein n=1 Tax=Rhizobium sp. 18055 TaxID=2681403 RepID=UPI00135AF6F9|nr:hypothetical protein [Rhizobium sp. 18055]